MFAWAQHSVPNCSNAAALVAYEDFVVGLSCSRVGLNVTEHEGVVLSFWFGSQKKRSKSQISRSSLKNERLLSVFASYPVSVSLHPTLAALRLLPRVAACGKLLSRLVCWQHESLFDTSINTTERIENTELHHRQIPACKLSLVLEMQCHFKLISKTLHRRNVWTRLCFYRIFANGDSDVVKWPISVRKESKACAQ